MRDDTFLHDLENEHLLGVLQSHAFHCGEAVMTNLNTAHNSATTAMYFVMGSVVAFVAMFGHCRKCCGDLRKQPFFADILRKAGIDKFPDFDLYVTCHEAIYDEKVQTQMIFKAGREFFETSPGTLGRAVPGSKCAKHMKEEGMTDDKTAHISFEATEVMEVNQGTKNLTIEMYDVHKFRSKTLLASAKMNIWEDLLHEGEQHPKFQDEVIELKRTSKGSKLLKTNPTLFVTFSCEGGDCDDRLSDGDEKDGFSPLKAILADTEDASFALKEQLIKTHDGKFKDINTKGMLEGEQRLMLAAAALEGPLDVTGDLGSHKVCWCTIFQEECDATDRKKHSSAHLNGWSFGWFRKEKEAKAGKPEGTVPILGIQGVTPDPGRGEDLILRYHEEGAQGNKMCELRLARVDRPRDVWVDLFHLFIGELRNLRAGWKSRKEPKSKKDDKKSHGDGHGHHKSSHGEPHSHSSVHGGHSHKSKKESEAEDHDSDTDTSVDKCGTGSTKSHKSKRHSHKGSAHGED